MPTSYMSEREYEARLKQIKAQNLSKERKRKLKAEKAKYRKPVKLPSTSKLILLAVILINVQIIWFVEKAMMQWGDFSAVYALIGIPATLIPIVWGYYSKSKAENTEGGIRYMSVMEEMRRNSVYSSCDEDVVSDDTNSTAKG